MSEWVVNTKGRAGSKSFEVSVLRSDNAHGKGSYGWFDKNKLLISHNGGPCGWPVTKPVWTRLVAVAHEVANELNDEES